MTRRRRHLAGIVLACLVAGCGTTDAQDAVTYERATQRGFAAAVLAHVAPRIVTSVQIGSGPELAVDLSFGGGASMMVTVGDHDPGLGCSVEQTFNTTYCRGDGEVVVGTLSPGQPTTLGGGPVPVAEGRGGSASRGYLLVMMWGTRTPADLALIRSVLEDRRVGVRTTRALNRSGSQLPGVEPLKVYASMSSTLR